MNTECYGIVEGEGDAWIGRAWINGSHAIPGRRMFLGREKVAFLSHTDMGDGDNSQH